MEIIKTRNSNGKLVARSALFPKNKAKLHTQNNANPSIRMDDACPELQSPEFGEPTAKSTPPIRARTLPVFHPEEGWEKIVFRSP
jgi:hypothetical protein